MAQPPFLNIEEKEDSIDRLNQLIGIPTKFTYTALEWNLIVSKVNKLYELILNVESDGSTGEFATNDYAELQNNFEAVFESEADLIAEIPNPSIGKFAFVKKGESIDLFFSESNSWKNPLKSYLSSSVQNFSEEEQIQLQKNIGMFEGEIPDLKNQLLNGLTL